MIKIKCEEPGDVYIEIVRVCIHLLPVPTMEFTVILSLFLDKSFVRL